MSDRTNPVATKVDVHFRLPESVGKEANFEIWREEICPKPDRLSWLDLTNLMTNHQAVSVRTSILQEMGLRNWDRFTPQKYAVGEPVVQQSPGL